jgi:hypothetical protein
LVIYYDGKKCEVNIFDYYFILLNYTDRIILFSRNIISLKCTLYISKKLCNSLIAWTKANLKDIFCQASKYFIKRLFYIISFVTLFHSIWPFHIVYNFYNHIFENLAVQAWTINILEGFISCLSKRKTIAYKSRN